jgi:valyl-tRNA synthetase
VGKLTVGAALPKPESAASDVVEDVQLFIPLKGIIDVAREAARLRRRIEEAEGQLAASDATLKNPNVLTRAPEEIVQAERKRNAELTERAEKLRASLRELG